jgi:putative endonuclease
MYYVYILKSKVREEIYIGSTNNLKRRIQEHNNGFEISTKRYVPWSIYYYESYLTEKLARVREKRLKHNGNAIRELKKRIGLRVYPAPLSSRHLKYAN